MDEEFQQAPVPPTDKLEVVAKAARTCHACDLWRNATQTVFGEGSLHPKIMLVGEQPGDKEDLEGRPFVGPAGRVLNESLEQAGIKRKDIYVTNAVKHFRWEPEGHRRLHKKPNKTETDACRPWLEAEIKLLKPQAIVLMGATAAQSILGPEFKLTEHRGEVISSTLASILVVTVHPSSLLRIPDRDKRVAERDRFVQELRWVSEMVGKTRRLSSA